MSRFNLPPHPQQEQAQIYMPKLQDGWFYVPISPKTWELLSHFGDQEKIPDEGLQEALRIALHCTAGSAEKVLDDIVSWYNTLSWSEAESEPRISISTLIKKIAELRSQQQQEREQ